MATATMTHTTYDAIGRPRKNVRAVVRLVASSDHAAGVAHNLTGNYSLYGRNAIEVKTDPDGAISVDLEVTDDIDSPLLPCYTLQYHPPGESPSEPLFFVVPPGGGPIEESAVEPPDPGDLDGGEPATSIYPWTIDGGTP